jgi:predicted amidohydrolase
MGPVNTTDSRQATIVRLISLLERAANQSCQLAVFPELALTTFFPRTYRPDLAQAHAFYETSMPSPDLEPLFELARHRKIGFSLGFAELDRSRSPARRYNTQILVNDEGTVISKYRKIHLPGHTDFRPDDPFQNLEKVYFEVGDLGFPVVEAFGGKLGMCICNDRRWPETYRILGLKGVEMIVLGYTTPTHNPRADQSPELRMFHNHLCMQAGAYQNSTWVVGVAKAGREDGVDLMGGSCIINPNGIIVACAQSLGDELVVADCDLDDCLNGKAEEFNFARNRRPEHYAELTVSTPDGVLFSKIPH